MDSDIVKLINKIYKMHGDSISEKIIDYCETYDEDVQEIGDMLSESEDFKQMMYRDCVKYNIIRDKHLVEKQNTTEEIDIWD